MNDKSYFHSPQRNPRPYGPQGRRLTPFDHKGFSRDACDSFVDTVTLHSKRVAFEMAIDEREAAISKRSKLSSWEDHATRSLRIQMRMTVWGEEDRTTSIAKVPATWEDAFKLGLITVFDNPVINWFVKRSPIRYKEVKASLSVHYPDFVPSLPDQDYVCRVQIMKF